LLAVTDETLQQFKILSPLVHSLTLGCGPSLKPENFFQILFGLGEKGREGKFLRAEVASRAASP